MIKRIGFLLALLVVMTGWNLAQAAPTPDDPRPQVAQEGGEVGIPVTPIAVDFGVVGGYRYLRVSGQNVPVYDAPRGDILYRFTDGYNFVTPRNERGNWTEINPGEWVETEYLVEVFPSYFTGVIVDAEPATPWGWILVGHYASAEPTGPEVIDAAYWVDRYTITYFYETVVDAEGWRWYNVGGGRWVKQTLVSKVQRVANPGINGRWVAVDLYEQNLVAYDGNTMVFATLISSGLPGNDTNEGVFDIWASSRNAPMDGESGGYGDYRLENVPYAMYFDNDISLHGTYWHNRFGYRQSRGCVNVTISDARWLYEWMGGDNGSVYVYYSQSY